jgi:hypothetical protein
MHAVSVSGNIISNSVSLKCYIRSTSDLFILRARNAILGFLKSNAEYSSVEIKVLPSFIVAF